MFLFFPAAAVLLDTFVVRALLLALLVICVAIVVGRRRDKRAASESLQRIIELVESHGRKGHLLCSLLEEGRRMLIVANPHSGGGSGEVVLRRFLDVLHHLDIDSNEKCDILLTKRAGHARNAVAEALAKRKGQRGDATAYAAVLCIGGDGSLNEVLNGMIGSISLDDVTKNNKRSNSAPSLEAVSSLFRATPLMLLPAGSSNGVAFALHLTENVDLTIMKLLLLEQPRRIDVMRCDFLDASVDDCVAQIALASNLANANESDAVRIIEAQCIHAHTQFALSHVSWAIVAEHDVWQEQRLRGIVRPLALKNIVASVIAMLLRQVFRVRLLLHLSKRVTFCKEFSCPSNVATWPTSLDAAASGQATTAGATAESDDEAVDFTSSDQDDNDHQPNELWTACQFSELVGLSVCNLKYPEAHLPMAPVAKAHSGMLDVMLMDAEPTMPSLISMLRMFIAMYDGRHVLHPRVHYVKAKRVVLSPAAPALLNHQGSRVISADGELHSTPFALDIQSYEGAVYVI